MQYVKTWNTARISLNYFIKNCKLLVSTGKETLLLCPHLKPAAFCSGFKEDSHGEECYSKAVRLFYMSSSFPLAHI